MALQRRKITLDTIKDGGAGGASYINGSGIYDVEINFASIAKTEGGAESVNFNVNYNGNEQTLWGPYITSKAGEVLFGMDLIDKLSVIAGMNIDQDFDIETETHTVGKDKKPQDFEVITNFSGLPVKVRIQLEYTVNQKTGEIKESKVIKSFFAQDGASAEELLRMHDGEEVEIGKRYRYELDKLASNITYKDGLTADDVDAWIAAKKDGKAAPKAAAPKVAPTARQSGLFKK